MTLAEVLTAAAAALDIEPEADAGGETSWRRGTTTFAALDATGLVASFRLDQTLAAAAQRTPDVSASSRGPVWVEFSPSELDGHALDRATAWFQAAHRRAGD
jgi:hypothetical protein